MTTGSPALVINLDHENQLTLYGTQHQLVLRQQNCLVALALRPQKVVSQATLYTAIWGHDTVEPAEMTHIITSLRKLGVPIVTLARRGYMLQMPPEEVSVLPVQPPCPDLSTDLLP